MNNEVMILKVTNGFEIFFTRIRKSNDVIYIYLNNELVSIMLSWDFKLKFRFITDEKHIKCYTLVDREIK